MHRHARTLCMYMLYVCMHVCVIHVFIYMCVFYIHVSLCHPMADQNYLEKVWAAVTASAACRPDDHPWNSFTCFTALTGVACFAICACFFVVLECCFWIVSPLQPHPLAWFHPSLFHHILTFSPVPGNYVQRSKVCFSSVFSSSSLSAAAARRVHTAGVWPRSTQACKWNLSETYFNMLI